MSPSSGFRSNQLKRTGSLREAIKSAQVIKYEANFTNVFCGVQRFPRAAHCDWSGELDWISKDAGGDGGKRDRRKLQLVSDANRLAMATGQGLRFATITAGPHWPDRMNDVTRRQSTGCRGDGLSLRKSPLLRDDPAAMVFDLRASGGMYGTVNATTAHQRGIGCIHYGIDSLARDVGRPGDEEQAAVAEFNAQRIGGGGQSEESNRIPFDDLSSRVPSFGARDLISGGESRSFAPPPH